MNRMKIFMMMVISFGVFASAVVAGNTLSDAEFHYGVRTGNQLIISQPGSPPNSAAAEVAGKGEKTLRPLPEDVLTPESFYGYKD